MATKWYCDAFGGEYTDEKPLLEYRVGFHMDASNMDTANAKFPNGYQYEFSNSEFDLCQPCAKKVASAIQISLSTLIEKAKG